jgi:transposase, IS5 family
MPTRSTRHGPHTSSVVQMLTDSDVMNPVRSRAAGRLEPCAGKLACTVLRGEHAGNGVFLPDGKARKPCEFGVKVSLAVTHRHGLMVGARSFPGNPYDGHTLAEQLEQTNTLLQEIGVKPTTAVVDLGFRGVDEACAPVQIIHRGKFKSLDAQQRRWLKRRQAIEPAIGHTKSDNRMDRCWLSGSSGDALHAVLCAAGFNIRWLLRAITTKGLAALLLVLSVWALYAARIGKVLRIALRVRCATRSAA